MVDVVRNASFIATSSREPKEFLRNCVGNAHKRKIKMLSDKVDIVDLKSSLNSLNQTSTVLWIPPKSVRKHNGTVATQSSKVSSNTLVSNQSQSMNLCSSLLETAKSDRNANRVMLSSYLSGAQVSDEQCWPCMSKNVTYAAVNKVAQFNHLSNTNVKQFDIIVNKNKLLWNNTEICGDIESEVEPFRAVPNVLREMIRDRTYLLDNHCSEGFPNSFGEDSSGLSEKQSILSRAVSGITVRPHQSGDSSSTRKLQMHALECALARHSEAVLDELLEMILDCFSPLADVLKQSDGDSEEGLGGGGDTNQLFDWEHVLCCLQASRSVAQHEKPQLDKPFPNNTNNKLQDLRLTPSVVDRTTSRLLGLYAGASCAGLSRTVSSVKKRRRVGEVLSGGIENKDVR